MVWGASGIALFFAFCSINSLQQPARAFNVGLGRAVVQRLQVEGSHAVGIGGAGAPQDRRIRFVGKRKGLAMMALGRASDWKAATASALAALQVRALLIYFSYVS